MLTLPFNDDLIAMMLLGFEKFKRYKHEKLHWHQSQKNYYAIYWLSTYVASFLNENCTFLSRQTRLHTV